MDLGCNDGKFIKFLLQQNKIPEIYGLDIDPQMVNKAIETLKDGKFSYKTFLFVITKEKKPKKFNSLKEIFYSVMMN